MARNRAWLVLLVVPTLAACSAVGATTPPVPAGSGSAGSPASGRSSG